VGGLVGDPLTDSNERACSGQYRCQPHGQNRGQPMLEPARVSRIGHGPQQAQQIGAGRRGTSTVLGQVAVAAKSNEIPAVRTLLASFDLAGVVVTVDAMHTQHDTAQLITDAGGDYVFTVKGNQPTLHAACKKLPWTQVRAHTAVTTGHGRRARRTIKVLTAPAWIPFTGAAQIAQIRRTVTRRGRKSVEVVYVITSANHLTAPPATLAAWVQGHWASRTGCTGSATSPSTRTDPKPAPATHRT